MPTEWVGNTIVTRMDNNPAIFKRILDDSEFREALSDFFVRQVYSRLRSAGVNS